MSRLQAVVLVVGTGIAWIGYSLGFQALGVPQMIEARAPGTLNQAQVQTLDQTITGYHMLATPTATPRPGVVTTVAPTQRPTGTPTSTVTPRPTKTPTPYVVREYPEQLPDGSIRQVRKWSDGRYEEVGIVGNAKPIAVPVPATPTAIPTATAAYPCLYDFFRQRPGEAVEVRINQQTSVAGGPVVINPSSGTTAISHSLTARLSFCPSEAGATIYFSAWQPVFLGEPIELNYGPGLLRNLTPGGMIPADRWFYLSRPWPINAERVLNVYPQNKNSVVWRVEPGYYLLHVGYKDYRGRIILPEVIFRMEYTR